VPHIARYLQNMGPYQLDCRALGRVPVALELALLNRSQIVENRELPDLQRSNVDMPVSHQSDNYRSRAPR